jgi:hypothetical protein
MAALATLMGLRANANDRIADSIMFGQFSNARLTCERMITSSQSITPKLVVSVLSQQSSNFTPRQSQGNPKHKTFGQASTRSFSHL